MFSIIGNRLDKKMKEFSETQFRKNFTETLDKVSKNNLPIIIIRENSQSVVMLSLKSYMAIESLLEVMEDPIRYARLLKKIENNEC